MRLRPGLALLAASLLPIFQTAFVHAQSARPAAGAPISQHSPSSAESQTQQRLSEQMRIRAAMARMHAHPGTSPHTSSGGAIIETIAGSAPFQSPITALKAGLGQTQGVVEDVSGNLYVSTGDLRTVLKIDTSGNTTVYAGVPLPTGPAVASGDGGPATAATLVSPMGLALDASGNLYIADSGSYTVRKVTASTGVISTVVGNGTFGHSGDGGQAISAQLEFPQALTLDGAGDLFVSDTDYVYGLIREVNLSSGVINTVAGTISGGNCFLSSSSCPATAVNLCIGTEPNGLAYKNGILYVAMISGFSDLAAGAVLSLPLSTGMAQVIAGGGTSFYTGDPNSALGAELLSPNIAVDQSGNLYITDDYAVIWQLPAGGTLLNVIAGTVNQFGYTGDGGPATSAELGRLSAIAISPSGKIIFADTERIRQIDTSGVISTVAGDGTANDFGDGGPAQKAGLDSPFALALDNQGNLFISDFNDNVIREVSRQSGFITTIAGNGTRGVGGNATTPSMLPGDGGPATQTALIEVQGLATDSNSHLYLGSYYQGIRVVNTATGTISTLNNTVQVSGGLVFDGKETLYVSAEDVYAINVNTGALTLIAGGGESSANGIPALQARISSVGLALDQNGNLYIADAFTDSVRVVSLSTGIIQTFAGGSSNRSSGDGGPASAAGFYSVYGLSYDGAGHLLIVDSASGVVRQVDLTTDIITTIAGNGTLGYSGDGASATAASLDGPSAVVADSLGNVYIADNFNNRIRGIVQPLSQLTGQLTASATTLTAGTTVTLTSTLSGAQSGIAPTGSVTFLDGTTSIGTSTLSASSTAGTYVATLTNNTLAAGTHSITAQYPGDANYAPVTTAAVVLTVTAPIPPSYAVAANPSSLSIAQGSKGTTVLTVTPAGGFNQTVSFSCGTGLPTGVSCSFSPASVTPTGTAPVSSTLTITTTGTSTAMLKPQIPETRWWLPTGATSLACLLMLGVPKFRRRGIWLALLFAILAAGANGCGSGGSSGGGGGGTNPNATPPGTYSIKLATTAGSGSSTESQPLTLSVTVTQ